LAFAGEHGVAAAAVDRALTLNPNSARAWAVRGVLFGNLDQPGPAIEAFERAMRLSPLDRLRRSFTGGIAIAHLTAGRYEEAVDWAERTLREEPGYRAAMIAKVVGCAHLGRIEEARAAVDQLIASQPGFTIAQYKARWSRAYSVEKMAIYVAGLRKAELPEE
jgi:tetratricopeptide (TPR) repeat protein